MGRFNQLRDKSNRGELDAAKSLGKIQAVLNELEKTRELTWNYNETYFNHMLEQRNQNQKAPGQVNMETLKQEVEGTTRPELGNYEEIAQYQLENQNPYIGIEQDEHSYVRFDSDEREI